MLGLSEVLLLPPCCNVRLNKVPEWVSLNVAYLSFSQKEWVEVVTQRDETLDLKAQAEAAHLEGRCPKTKCLQDT